MEKTSKALDMDAEFETVFAEQAEKRAVHRDLSQLSDAKRPLGWTELLADKWL